jgi:TRAP-type C4-dicarboxylate transport system permease small subunit
LIFRLYPQKVKIFLEVINKILGICIFALVSWRLCADGIDAYIIGETSSTLRIPVSLFQFALAAGFALMGLVIILKLFREQG